ncbi:MAG: hypothetical protein WC455_15985 [Dehalococcoidia bacterium]
MKQTIAKNRNEALAFVRGGRGQRRAFWAEAGKLFRFERLPGMEPTWSENAGELWWDVGTTVAQKFAVANAARSLRAIPSAKRTAQSRANGARGGRPRHGLRVMDAGGETVGMICDQCADEHPAEDDYERVALDADETGECFCCGYRVSGKMR